MKQAAISLKRSSFGLIAISMAVLFVLSACDTAVEKPYDDLDATPEVIFDGEVELDSETEVSGEGDSDEIGMDSTESEGDEMMDSETSEEDELSASITPYNVGVLEPFDEAELAAALEDGQIVLLDFYADWCPTCKANAPVVESVVSAENVVAFRVDFDSDLDVRTTYDVNLQSTYVILDGEDERRYTGFLSDDKLKDLISG